MAKIKIDEIKDMNDCLGYMLQIQNKDKICRPSAIIERFGKSLGADLDFYFRELEKEGYIELRSSDSIYINPKGRKGYLSPLKKFILKILPAVTCVLGYVMGCLTDDVRTVIHIAISFIKSILGKL